jgi:signal transduction histidine kinase
MAAEIAGAGRSRHGEHPGIRVSVAETFIVEVFEQPRFAESVEPVAPSRAQDQGVVSLVDKYPSEPAPGQINAQVTRVAPDPGGTLQSRPVRTEVPSDVPIIKHAALLRAVPDRDEASIRPTRDLPPGRAGDWADAMLLLVQDRDRIAGDMTDLVVRRLFSAGLALETALGLMGDHPGAGKVQDAVGELDLAIRDVRNVVFDLRQPDPPS